MHDLLGVCMCVAFCCRLRSPQVVERVVEVEPDKAALVEQLRAQMKAEMQAQQEQQLQGQALEAARQEAEARARQQLEVGSASWVMCVGSFYRLHPSACRASVQMYENQAEHECYTLAVGHGLAVHHVDVAVLHCCLQSLMTASNATEEQRLALCCLRTAAREAAWQPMLPSECSRGTSMPLIGVVVAGSLCIWQWCNMWQQYACATHA